MGVRDTACKYETAFLPRRANPITRSGFKFSQLEMSETKVIPKSVVDLTGLLFTEVALSQLIPAFQVALAETEIIWGFGGPFVKESVNLFSPKLPIVISRA